MLANEVRKLKFKQKPIKVLKSDFSRFYYRRCYNGLLPRLKFLELYVMMFTKSRIKKPSSKLSISFR